MSTGDGFDAVQVSEEIRKREQEEALRAGRRIGKDLYTGIITSISEGNIFTDGGDGKNSVVGKLKAAISEVLDPREIMKRTADLDVMATKLRNTLGLGSEKSREFSQAIADNAGRMIEYGFDVDDIVATYENLFKTFRTNVTISDEELLQLKATASVTGQGVDKLSESFRAVGVGINEVGDRMLEVTNVAKDAGVAVSAVAAGVVGNLEKMNIYNFEGGTKGLAKMSAQAARLNIDMSKIFAVVDQVFNPEGAIELAASLQRLGVSTNALLDPLRLMDLSQNDPTELQNQIVNMSKEFVRFNKELGQFEILPGEKRRLNEIGKALGMTNGELQKMALNAANLDFKMKQIKFPSSIASKEDRELIATLATVNKDGVAEVKVKKVDSEGKFTGEFEIKAVEDLTDEQIKALKEQQSHGQTMEELQKESLTEVQRTNYLLESIVTAIGYAESGSAAARDLYEFGTKSVRETMFKEGSNREGLIGEEFRNSKQYRMTIDNAYSEIKPIFKEVATGIKEYIKENGKDLITQMGIPTDAKGMLEAVTGKIDDILNTGDLTKVKDKILNVLGGLGMGGSTNDPLTIYNQKINQANTNNQIQNTNINNQNKNIAFDPLQILEEIKLDLNVKLDPDSKNQALTQLMTQALEEFFKGGDNKANVNMVKKSLEEDKTFQGMFKTIFEPQKTLVSAPGKTQ